MNDAFPLSGMEALVVGICDASGWAVVHALMEAGATVVSYTTMQEAGSDPTGQGFSAYCNPEDPENLQYRVGVAVERLRNLRILVNLAGEPWNAALEDTCDEDFDRVLERNLTYVMRTTRAVTPGMKLLRGGSIINVVNAAAFHPGGKTAAYAAAQGGVEAFTRATALDGGRDYGIRANCVVMDEAGGGALGSAVVYLAGEGSGMVTGATISLAEWK